MDRSRASAVDHALACMKSPYHNPRLTPDDRPLEPAIRRRVESLDSTEEVERLGDQVLTASSLEEMGSRRGPEARGLPWSAAESL